VSDPASVRLDDRVRKPATGELVERGGAGVWLMRALTDSTAVYLYRVPVDMRRGRNGLAAMASQMMPDQVYSGAVFLFVGRRFDTVKALRWDRNGFAVWHKVIESREKYYWPRMLSEEVVTLNVEQLTWLLDGYDVWRQPHQMLRLLHVN
jgi:transposase